MQQFRKNIRLTVKTVREHLSDDVSMLTLQTIQRLPQKVRNPLTAAGSALPGRPFEMLSTVSHSARGNRELVRRRAELAASRNASPRLLVRYADVLINQGDVEAARGALQAIGPETPGRAKSEARLLWYRGAMSDAISKLDGIDGARLLRERFESELRSLQGKRPNVQPVRAYQPREDRVMHILTNSLPHTTSGYAQRSHSILRSLSERGWNVMAVTRIGWPVQTGAIHASETDVIDDIAYRRILPDHLESGFDERLQQHAELLLEIVQQERPAILHTTTHWTNAMVVSAVASAVGIPWVYEVRGQLADTWAATRGEDARDSERYRLFVEREDEMSREADGVVTLGENMRLRLVEAGVGEDIVICPNAVGGDFLNKPQSTIQARSKLGLDPALEYIGTVSSVVTYEGFDTIVDAVAKLAQARPKLRFVLVGDGTALPGLMERARALGIEDRLIAPGRVDRSFAPTYHQALDVFVVPREDTPVTRAVTPMKSVEASASAKPVVASDLPALRELVKDQETGLLVAPGDVSAWALTLDALLDDELTRTRMGDSGRTWVLNERTWSANAVKYDALYRSLLRFCKM